MFALLICTTLIVIIIYVSGLVYILTPEEKEKEEQ